MGAKIEFRPAHSTMDDLRDLSMEELLERCLRSGEQTAWNEFVRRIQPTIAGVVYKALCRCRPSGKPSGELVDDLVQDTYIKIFRNNCKALREFKSEHENAIFGYLQTIASNCVHDYIRKHNLETDPLSDTFEDGHVSQRIEYDILFRELYQYVKANYSERDGIIFELRHRQGFTAPEIARHPGIKLTLKKVEYRLWRLDQLLKRAFGSAGESHAPTEDCEEHDTSSNRPEYPGPEKRKEK